MVPRWSKAPSLFFLSLPFFSVHHDLTEKRVIFSRINHVLGSGNGTTVANSGEISCHRDAKRPLLSSKGSSLIYIPLCLEFGRNANRYEEREIDLFSFRSDATLDTTTKTKILRIRSRCLEENLKRTVVRVAIPSSMMGPIHFERFSEIEKNYQSHGESPFDFFSLFISSFFYSVKYLNCKEVSERYGLGER